MLTVLATAASILTTAFGYEGVVAFGDSLTDNGAGKPRSLSSCTAVVPGHSSDDVCAQQAPSTSGTC